jgi:hypothetical protein
MNNPRKPSSRLGQILKSAPALLLGAGALIVDSTARGAELLLMPIVFAVLLLASRHLLVQRAARKR